MSDSKNEGQNKDDKNMYKYRVNSVLPTCFRLKYVCALCAKAFLIQHVLSGAFVRVGVSFADGVGHSRSLSGH